MAKPQLSGMPLSLLLPPAWPAAMAAAPTRRRGHDGAELGRGEQRVHHLPKWP
jgi:hypothetical protein